MSILVRPSQARLTFLACSLLALPLASCSIPTHTELATSNAATAILAGNSRALQCRNSAMAHPAVAPFAGKIGLGGLTENSSPALLTLSDPTFATKEEIDAILKLDALSRPCRELQLTALNTHAPLYVPIVLEWFTATDRVFLAVIEKRMKWGQAQQAFSENTTRFKTSMAKMDAFYQQQATQAHLVEIQQRQQVAAAFQQWSQNQQAVSAANRPRTTKCNYVGNSITCNSY